MQCCTKKRQRTAMVVGLDATGKTSMLCAIPAVRESLNHYAQANDVAKFHTQPTSALSLIEFPIPKSEHRRWRRRQTICWRVWDMSGQGRSRSLWQYYCGRVQAIVFVVDVCDNVRGVTARDELRTLFSHPSMRDSRMLLLVLANKMDAAVEQPDAMNGEKIRTLLGLDALIRENPRVVLKLVETSAVTGRGVEFAWQWLTDTVT